MEAAMARGRKRKSGKRHPSGKLVQPGAAETQREIMATVLEARQRHFGVSERQARDERLGTSLGRLAFAGSITPAQYAAGELYGETIARHRAVVGMPMAQPRSVTGLLINEGIFGGGEPEHDPDLVDRVRKEAAAALSVLQEADRDMPAGTRRGPSLLVHALACYDVDAGCWSAADLKWLAQGLDALARLYRIRMDSS
jgi:hypothetical protein